MTNEGGHTTLLSRLLTELAGVLMLAGVSATEFEAAAKMGFIQAAGRVAKLRNSRVNRSAVATMTGLSRVEVKRLMESGPHAASGRARQRALRVLDGWQIDPRFV